MVETMADQRAGRIVLSGPNQLRDTRMRPIARSILPATLLLAVMAATPVHAQVDSREGIALQNQIYQLRQQVQSLQDQVGRGGAASRPTYIAPPSGASGDLVAQLLTRVDSLEEQMRQLRGQLQETQNQQQRSAADLNKRVEDLS